MTTWGQFRAELKKNNVQLFLDSRGRIIASPAGKLSEEALTFARAFKDELVAELPYRAGPVSFVYVVEPGGVDDIARACAGADVIGLDTETTGLNPRSGRVRLLQLAPTAAGPVYLVDVFRVGAEALAPLRDVLDAAPVAMHNALFDLQFLHGLGLRPTNVYCTMLTARLLTAGTHAPCDQKSCAARWLRLYVSKELQGSHWGAPELTREQLR
jgi:hypothetical protein